ncbi:hypothetical protein H1230_09410 [Paenibacillus sp. 19GGS1-52]|uniref:hypothetical protein n=1 Tax=Paenibacillus sp. 19GGS1-52 TaxID=2758563 RepID=UPI001EFA98B7|nr:hypothetical protein [Paenibacillus sp. 19GGS1-52]ULO08962.1 hypothetical protein H1230_09410 [Paenibacillus sp. 19GGS1-52]
MRKVILFSVILMLLAGCSSHLASPQLTPGFPVSPTETATVTNNPLITASAGVITASKESEVISVVTGEFITPWSNPMNNGTATVTQISSGLYHLEVSVVHGFGHNTGGIDSDFSFNGTKYVFTNPEYQAVRLTFDERSLNIDYPEDVFGGYNAEPKGTFYLKNSGPTNVPFLKRLYDMLQLQEDYRGYFTDVLTYILSDTEQILLVQTRSSFAADDLFLENLVLFNTVDQRFELLGKFAGWNSNELSEKLVTLQASPELINELLHKQQADRFTELKMEKFDSLVGFDPDQINLTKAEAFYVVTGIKNATSVSNNKRDENNIGSVFITEVDHWDDKKVTIHSYENVRNDEEDEHTATTDWLEIDRSTGMITSIF